MNTTQELIALVRRTALSEEVKRHHEAAGVLAQAGDALEALQSEVARHKLHIKHIGNDALRTENAALQTTVKHLSDAVASATFETKAALARLAAIEAQEPVAWQYQSRDGFWQPFLNDKHYDDTKADGSWPIRAVYAAAGASPQPVQTSRDHRGEIIDVLCDDVFGETYESPQPVGK